MYFQPYGDEQQLNLNWIINEIINLHKQFDPNYETPSFTQVYPYSNLNRLNLDWVLSELKALKELAPGPAPTIDIQAVAEALVALPFDSTKSYQIYDFISKDGEIWRATEAIAAGGAWDETKWFKTKLGTDLAVLERWINAINASLTTLENTVNELSSADISDDSDAGGATVKASLNNLKGSLNTITPLDSVPTSDSTKGVTSGGVYDALADKQNTLTFDATPTQNSTNPVTSGGMYNALAVQSGVPIADVNYASGSNTHMESYRTGHVALVQYIMNTSNVNIPITQNGYIYFIIVPEGFRPSFDQSFQMTFDDANGAHRVGMASIFTSGRVGLYVRTSTEGSYITNVMIAGIYLI